MEPVTHILTGACLARTGLNRKAAYATVTMAIAAQFPDIDTLWSLRGPVEGFQHHRGITHTFLGVPFEAAAIVAGVWAVHRWRVKRHARLLAEAPPPDSEPDYRPSEARLRLNRPLTAAPVRWGLLYGFALLALLSHLLLDFTNNYGLRPFFPFNPHWYAASIVFIFDPLIFLTLVAALTLPALFGLIGREVGVRRQAFRPRGWAIVALTAIVAYWGLRAFEHGKAVALAMNPTTVQLPESDAATQEQAIPLAYRIPRVAWASPHPWSPFVWHTVADYGQFYEVDTVDTRVAGLASDGVARAKWAATPQVLAAQGSPLGRAFMDWSALPAISQDDPDAAGRVLVRFEDLRFLNGLADLLPSTEDGSAIPLAAEIVVDRNGRVIDQISGGKSETRGLP